MENHPLLAEVHARLGGSLVGAILERDDILAGSQRLLREVARVGFGLARPHSLPCVARVRLHLKSPQHTHTHTHTHTPPPHPRRVYFLIFNIHFLYFLLVFVGNSDVCCITRVTSVDRYYLPFVGSTPWLWRASFYFQTLVTDSQLEVLGI